MGLCREARLRSDGSTEKNRQLYILVGLVWVGLLLFHANKAIGLYPITNPDEYWYTSDIRHRAWADTVFPGYLYYALYWVTTFFQERFIDAGRVLNAFFFMLSAPFIYKTARTVGAAKPALFVTLIILLSPWSSYTMFFMPESLYFAVFWAFVWLVVDKSGATPVRTGIVMGIGISVLSMIKAHGVFLLPGCVLYLLCAISGNDRMRSLRLAGQGVAALVCSFAVVRLGIGFVFAGLNGLNPLGPSYTSVGVGGILAMDKWLLAEGTARTLFGHLACLSMLFGLPLVFAALYLKKCPLPASADPLRRIVLIALCLLMPLLVIVAATSSMFTANYEVFETSSINWRYYCFLFPAFPIIVLGVLERSSTEKRGPSLGTVVAYALPILVCLYIALTDFYGYFTLALGSNPELGGLAELPYGVRIAAGVFLLVLAAALFMPVNAGKCYLYVVWPLACLLASFGTYLKAMETGIFPSIMDKGGIFARDYLKEKCADLTLVDSFRNDMSIAMIHIDNPRTDMLPQFTPVVDMEQIKPGKKWLLIFGGIDVPDHYVKSKIEYVDPRQTPELTELMRQRNDFRMHMSYKLVELKR